MTKKLRGKTSLGDLIARHYSDQHREFMTDCFGCELLKRVDDLEARLQYVENLSEELRHLVQL